MDITIEITWKENKLQKRRKKYKNVNRNEVFHIRRMEANKEKTERGTNNRYQEDKKTSKQ